eukprot:632818-Hanusia_phi.AAC.1
MAAAVDGAGDDGWETDGDRRRGGWRGELGGGGGTGATEDDTSAGGRRKSGREGGQMIGRRGGKRAGEGEGRMLNGEGGRRTGVGGRRNQYRLPAQEARGGGKQKIEVQGGKTCTPPLQGKEEYGETAGGGEVRRGRDML